MARQPDAAELRAQGLTYSQIADRLGVSISTAFRRADPAEAEADRKHCRAYKARNHEAMRAYKLRYGEEHRAVCPHCGHVYGKHSAAPAKIEGRSADPHKNRTFRYCPSCVRLRNEQIVIRWGLGHSMREIWEWLGWTKGHLSATMDRMRRAGYELPHRYNVRGPVPSEAQ